MFDNSTMLTKEWLLNEMSYEMEGFPKWQENKFKDYYTIICGFIRDRHFLRLSPAEIEEYITNGEYTYTSADIGEVVKITCNITDKDERAYYFKLAQAKQLIYDFNNGRAAMIRGEDMRYGVCADTINALKILGLRQRTETLR